MIIIKNAIDEHLLEAVYANFPSEDWKGWHHYSDKDAEKYGSKPYPELFPHTPFPSCVAPVLYALADKVSSHIVQGCFPDFDTYGSGLHMLKPGGYLRPHLDSSIHPLTGWKREYSCVLFCNKNWDRKDGGCFGMANKTNTVLPLWNTVILFRTTEDSVHWVSKITGDKTRKSISLFYWSKEQPKDPTRNKAKFL